VAQDVDAGHRRAATVRTGEGGEDADGGRLAGAVGTQHPEDLALGDVEVEASEGVRLAEGLVEADGLDHGSGHGETARLLWGSAGYRDSLRLARRRIGPCLALP
jgi:hypothetical protein